MLTILTPELCIWHKRQKKFNQQICSHLSYRARRNFYTNELTHVPKNSSNLQVQKAAYKLESIQFNQLFHKQFTKSLDVAKLFRYTLTWINSASWYTKNNVFFCAIGEKDPY